METARLVTQEKAQVSKERLFEDFPPVSDEQWRSVVEKDLKGADYEKRLVWHPHPGLTVQPYYRSQDLESLGYLKSQAPGVFPYVRGKKTKDNRWLICQAITRQTPAETNSAAMKALGAGAEAVCFRSTAHEDKLYDQRILNLADIETLLKGIDLTSVPVHFNWSRSTPQAAAYLKAHCEKNGIDADLLTGSLEFDPLGMMASTGLAPADSAAYWDRVATYLVDARAALPGMRHLVIHTDVFVDAGSNLTQGLAFVISQAVEIIDALTDRGISAEDALKLMGVKAAVSSSYFLEIAFFRALRLLWADMAAAYNVKNSAAQVWIHAETCAFNKTVYDPHVNILRQTTETMSAVIGGVDVISVLPWDAVCGTSTEASERLARNTQLVIREETGLDHAVDAAAGSYYIENLTDGLAESAWKMFQEIENSGGFFVALESGTIAARIKESRSELEKGVASRSIALLGTNQFPHGSETMADKLKLDEGFKLVAAQLATCPSTLATMIALASPGLPFSDPLLGEAKAIPAVPSRRRLAEAYEELRLSVESLSIRPCVYLWTFGDLAFRKVRAGFCQNLYACAGFKIVEGRGSTDVDENLKAIGTLGAKWIVFCASDGEYPAVVPGLVKALIARFPHVVPVVAGYPPDGVLALKQAGIADFVHLKTDAVSYLRECAKIARGGE